MKMNLGASAKGFVCGVLVATVGLTSVTAAGKIKSAQFNATKVVLNGQNLALKDQMITVVKDGEASGANYMPVRAVLEAMGYTVGWDAASNAVSITGGAPQAAPAAKPAPSSQLNESEFPLQVFEGVNAERAKAGLKPYVYNDSVALIAQRKAQDMADTKIMSHESAKLGKYNTMLDAASILYKTAGENVAAGQIKPSEVMSGWMNSPLHKANILDADFAEIGIGYAKDSNGKTYWAQIFIG